MVCYSDAQDYGNGHLNSGLSLKWWSEYGSVNQMVIWITNYHGIRHLNSKPFGDQTDFHHLNTELVCYSDPQCGSQQNKTSFYVSNNKVPGSYKTKVQGFLNMITFQKTEWRKIISICHWLSKFNFAVSLLWKHCFAFERLKLKELYRNLWTIVLIPEHSFLFCFIDPQVQVSVDAFNEFCSPADIDFFPIE